MNIRQILRPTFQQPTPVRKQQKSQPRQRTDQATWSQQAFAYLEEQNRRVWEQDSEDSGDSTLKLLEKAQKQQDKCLKIASRLRHGDKIPPEDEAYLMKKDPAGYLLALSQRVENPHPKKWESLLDEEDRKELATGATEGIGTATSTGTITGPLGGPDGITGE